MKRATIRDIAERCGVSHTIVSAVLNRPWVRSRCSKEKCELIRQTAREGGPSVGLFREEVFL